jgi:hypothetical protein
MSATVRVVYGRLLYREGYHVHTGVFGSGVGVGSLVTERHPSQDTVCELSNALTLPGNQLIVHRAL